jgi:hypothetical protein
MSRELTKLRIDEVSAVDAAAGENCKILLRKRDHDVVAKASAALRESVGLILDSDGSEEEKRQELVETFTQFQMYLDREITGKSLGKGVLEREQRRVREGFAKIFAGKAADDGDHDAVDRHDRVPVVDHHASKVADLLVESGKYPHRAAALDHLLHSASGAALLSRLNKAADQPKDNTMSTSLGDILKTYGATRICKHICEVGKTGYSEFDLVDALTKHAAEQFNLPGDRAFAKLYESEESVRRACNIAAKSMPVTPTMVGGPDAMFDAVDNTEQSEAYAQLVSMAEKMRAASPELRLSAAQAFDKVFTDPKNAALAAAAHVRPRPTTYYEFPR